MSRYFSIAAAYALSLVLLAIAAYLLRAFALPAALVLLEAGIAHPRLMAGAALLAAGLVVLAAFAAVRPRGGRGGAVR
jgi:hypothetical protein